MQNGNEIIGFIVYTDKNHQMIDVGSERAVWREFWCVPCAEPCDPEVREHAMEMAMPVHRINIGLYSQTCTCCGKLIVDGVKLAANTKLPLNLFEKEYIGNEDDGD